ncbi:carcinoembryonic antigen-related cell adhesion molecule 1 isoform X2, partial [Silurus asotus]
MHFQAVFCILLLLTCTGVSFGQQLLLPERIDIKVGENLVITPITIPVSSRISAKWNYNGTSFLTEVHSGIVIQPPYTDRASLNTNTLALTLKNLTQSDSGQYALEVQNVTVTFRGVTSVQVFDGPENVAVKADPVGPIYRAGSNIILTCSAESSPAAEIHWAVNGSALSQMGHEHTINNIQSSQSGSYTCIVHNTKTLRYFTSHPISITVLATVNEYEQLKESQTNLDLSCLITDSICLILVNPKLLTAFCLLILIFIKTVSLGQGLSLPEKMEKKVNENLMIIPNSIPAPPYLLIKWQFNGSNIIYTTASGIETQPPYTDRASLDTTTLALTLRSLTESDSGLYALVVDTPLESLTGVTSVQVFVPVANVTILPSQTELVEFNSTVSLWCSASGSFLTFVWLNRSSEVTADDRVQLADSNSSLTITNVTRGDRGPYHCNVSNSVSKGASSPLSLTIYYGPENVAVKADPVGPIYRAGSNVILTCSAESSPAAEFQWAVNGSALGQMGHELTINDIQSSQSGSYTCITHNTKTLRYSTSEPISITVL